MPKKITRAYKGSDAFMTQQARVSHGLAMQELALFTAFDSTITTAFMDRYMADLLAAETVIDDSVAKAIVLQKTEIRNAVMKTAITQCKEVKFFAAKAFRASKATKDLFAYKNLHALRQDTNKMLEYLRGLESACTEYNTQLVAAGCPKAMVGNITAVIASLEESYSLQQAAKNVRPKLTEERIVTLNKCYANLALLNLAARHVYAGDGTKSRQFYYWT